MESGFQCNVEKERSSLWNNVGNKYPKGWLSLFGGETAGSWNLPSFSVSVSCKPGCLLYFLASFLSLRQPGVLLHRRWNLKTWACYVVVLLFIVLIRLQAVIFCFCPIARSSCPFAFCIACLFVLILLIKWVIYMSRSSLLPSHNANCVPFRLKLE